jgi:hypothetical protein
MPPGTPDAVMAQTGTGKKKRKEDDDLDDHVRDY